MNTNRTIDDDMLSAYLDGELPEQDLQRVRAALVNDPELAARFAALQSVNDLVVRHAKALDTTPLPASVLALLKASAPASGEPALQTPARTDSANVVQGPWQRWSRHVGAQLALAASLVLALGLALSNLLDPAAPELPALLTYSDALDKSPSGTPVAIDGGTLVNRFSFRDQTGRYCRQYQLSGANAGSENVACRTERGWALAATLPVPAQASPDAYQPASSSPELNAVLDRMMQGAALDLSTEAMLIERGWRAE